MQAEAVMAGGEFAGQAFRDQKSGTNRFECRVAAPLRRECGQQPLSRQVQTPASVDLAHPPGNGQRALDDPLAFRTGQGELIVKIADQQVAGGSLRRRVGFGCGVLSGLRRMASYPGGPPGHEQCDCQ